jgi:hypothetical protein
MPEEKMILADMTWPAIHCLQIMGALSKDSDRIAAHRWIYLSG